MDNTVGFIMDLETAEEFFKRCIYKEAVTLQEKQAILKELVQEKRAKGLNNEELNKTIKNKKVLVKKQKKG